MAASGCKWLQRKITIFSGEKMKKFFLIIVSKRDFHSRDLKEKSFKGEVSLKKKENSIQKRSLSKAKSL